MKLIPSYQEFVYDLPLNGKISPELAESLAADFEEIESLNEGFLDSIKNTLSKTFLGSLSYINMLDKARESLVKDQKDLLSKRYAHEDEMDSLNSSLDQANKAKDKANADKISKTISNKENEYKTYVNMVKKRIDKVEETVSKMIQGNKRRSEYYDAGKSEDEVVIAEFEYRLAKSRVNSDPKDIKNLEIKVQTAKEEAGAAQAKLEKDAKKQKELEQEKEEGKKSEISTNVDQIESAIEGYEIEIKELEHRKINSKNKKLEEIDQDRLEFKKAQVKKLKNKLKEIEKTIKGSRKNQNRSKKNQNGSKKLEDNMDNFVDKNQEKANLKVVKPEPAKAQSKKNPK